SRPFSTSHAPEEEHMTRLTQPQCLRLAFAAGAVTDALAVIPILSPRMASLMWGFEGVGGPYRFVIYGLVATDVVAVAAGHVPLGRMLPTWTLQAALLGLFAGAYHS